MTTTYLTMSLEYLRCSGRKGVPLLLCLDDHVEVDKGIARLYDQTYHKMRIRPFWIHHLFGDCCKSSCNIWYGSEGGRKYRRHTLHNCVDVGQNHSLRRCQLHQILLMHHHQNMCWWTLQQVKTVQHQMSCHHHQKSYLMPQLVLLVLETTTKHHQIERMARLQQMHLRR